MLRTGSAIPHPAGWVGLSTDLQFFSANNFLAQDQDHSRLINSYAINWALFRFLEVALALHMTSDNNNSGPQEELQVAIGDPEISFKGGTELFPGLGLGGLIDIRFPSGAGFFQASAAATSVYFALLGSWLGTSQLPLTAHLNLGFYLDGSKHLFEEPGELSAAQLYSAQVSSFHRFITRIALEYPTTYVGPFLELSLEKYVGDGAPGFGDSPGWISFGARAWPTKSKGLQVMAALDLGLTGVASGEPLLFRTENTFAYVLPRWNVLFQLSYRFDPFITPEHRPRADTDGTGGSAAAGGGEGMGSISGVVLDSKTEKPVWNAHVHIEGKKISSLAVNGSDGTFATYPLPPGSQILLATAEGYDQAKVTATVSAQKISTVTIKLNPRTSTIPGTLRGTIKTVAGKEIANATILIPEVDKNIQAGKDGTFSVALDPGEYKIVVSAPSYRTQTKLIRIQEGSTVILNVDLHK